MPKNEEEWKEFWKKKYAKQLEYAKRRQNRDAAKHQESSRYYLNTIRFSNRSGSHVGCFRYWKGNTPEHEFTKFLVYSILVEEGYEVIVEPIFEGTNRRADLIDLSRGIIFEVLGSETLEEAKEKVKNYPPCFEVRFIDANKPLNISDLL